jgi:hypothetical protein
VAITYLFKILTATAKNAKGAAAVELVKQALEVINQNSNILFQCKYLRSKKYLKKKIFFVGIFKITDEKGRIRSWIRIRNQVYGSKKIRIHTKMSRIQKTGVFHPYLFDLLDPHPGVNIAL